MGMDTPLIDKVYESCFVPEFWPGVLDELGSIAGAPGASLFVLRNDGQYCITSPEPRERAQRLIKEGWLWRGSIISRLFAQRHSGFLIDVDFFSPEELEQEPIYRDVWRPQGVGWGMATAIPIPTGENAMFVLSRRTELGPFERSSAQRLDELRPHLARSVLISARLQLERARVASEALAAMGIPALVLDETGRALAANALIEAMSGWVHWRAFDRVSLTDNVADHLLRDAIETIGSEIASSVRSFPVRNAHANAMMVAHVIPVRLSARDIFLRCATVLAMTPVTPPQAPPVELVQSLFDLTPAEARVARSLAAGKTVENIASDGNVSLNTVRTHVRGVLEKTGCNRQAEVVALLTGIVPPRHPGPG
jgi:DNA-binding CsgD family transcriptional regulator